MTKPSSFYKNCVGHVISYVVNGLINEVVYKVKLEFGDEEVGFDQENLEMSKKEQHGV